MFRTALLCAVEKEAPFGAAHVPSLQGLCAVVLLLLQELLLPLTPKSFQQLLQQLCTFLLWSIGLLGQGHKKAHFFVLHPSILSFLLQEVSYKIIFPFYACSTSELREMKVFWLYMLLKWRIFRKNPSLGFFSFFLRIPDLDLLGFEY